MTYGERADRFILNGFSVDGLRRAPVRVGALGWVGVAEGFVRERRFHPDFFLLYTPNRHT